MLDDEDLAVLAQQTQSLHYNAHQYIFHKGDAGGVLYILESGVVELFLQDMIGTEVKLMQVAEGQAFGEMSLFDNLPRSASARALTSVKLIAVPKDALMALMMARPYVALALLETLSARLRYTSTLVEERIIPNVNDTIQVSRSLPEKISDFFTNISGNIYFVLLSLIWFVVWIAWNMEIIPGVEAFDPFPFGLLTMVVSLEMVFLSLFILIKQSRQAANDKIRNDVEYEINVRAEVGVRNMLQRLEQVEQRLSERLDRIETQRVPVSVDATIEQPMVERYTR